MKICTKCKMEKELNQFYNTKYNTKTSWCKKCFCDDAIMRQKQNPEKWKKYLKDTQTKPEMIFARKKANAKKEVIYFNIIRSEFILWYNSQKIQCHYCGLKPQDFITTQDKHLAKKVNLGLDRINNERGYELDNIVLCCNRCNSIKGEFFTYNEMKIIGHKFVRGRWLSKGINLGY